MNPQTSAAGKVEAIYIAAVSGADPVRVDRVLAVAGKGLAGDRYAAGAGAFSNYPGNGRHLTMIDRQVTQRLQLPGGTSRRNLETSGIDLSALVGKYFTIGEVLAYGARRCEPCSHLTNLLGRPELLKELADCDGLRVDILSTAELQPGAAIRVLGEQLNVYLDDERPPPQGWFLVRRPDEAIELLKTGAVRTLSLDHDLGDDQHGTGYDVVVWIEEHVLVHQFQPPSLLVHSANPSARAKMEAGIQAIRRYLARTTGGES